MSESNAEAGRVLAAATSVGGGAAVLPLTGGTPWLFILPLVAIASGLIILASLTITRVLTK